jgi:hypothetical protein
LVFEKNANFFAENWQKSQKIVIITSVPSPGLPAGFHSDRKSQYGYIWEDLEMVNIVIYSGHLEYYMTVGHILLALGNVVVIWYIVPRKTWQT